jgi:hypothetical protein
MRRPDMRPVVSAITPVTSRYSATAANAVIWPAKGQPRILHERLRDVHVEVPALARGDPNCFAPPRPCT